MINKDLIKNCVVHTYTSLFPKNVSNKKLVYLINFIHIIGVIIIQFGIFLPPKLLRYYIFYLLFLFFTYFVFKNKCFMTELSNYIGNSYYDSLCIKMTQAKFLLLLYLFSACIFYIKPTIAPYTIINHYAKF
jgi:hypothetical protein